MPQLVRRLVSQVERCRVAVEGFARPVHHLRPQGLRLWQLDVGKEDGGLDACDERRVLGDTQSPLDNAVGLRALRVGEVLLDAILTPIPISRSWTLTYTCVLGDTRSHLGNAIELRALRVGGFLLDVILTSIPKSRRWTLIYTCASPATLL